METKVNVPRLRFPEFVDEWKKIKLEDVAEKIQDGTHFSPQAYDKGDFLYITSKNVKNGYMELSSAQYITKEDHQNIYKRCDVKKGDVLLTKDGTIGQVCVNELEEEFSLLSSVAFIRQNRYNSNYFIYQILVSSIGQKEIESQIAGQALKRITLTKINNFEYYFPILLEQTKIANFLKTIDDKLSQLKKKKSLLEQYKKGIMQQLFSLELRFKNEGGKDYPDWEEKKLEEIADVKGGKRIPKGFSLEATNNGFPYITVSDMENGSVSMDKIQYVPLSVVKVISNYKISTKDIYVSVAGTLGLIGIIPDELENANLTENANKITNIKCNQRYLLHYLKSEYFKKLIDSVKTIGAQPKLAIYAINGFIVPLPSLPEQTKIATFLSALDDKIAQTALQIEKMQLWKKGLLQQMFV